MIKFSKWYQWKDRADFVGIKNPGVYVIARDEPKKKLSLSDDKIVYIGETCGNLRHRLRQFNYSASTGKGRHSGGKTYYRKNHGRFKILKLDNLYVAMLAIPKSKNDIWFSQVRLQERHAIHTYTLRHKHIPPCNKK